MPDVAPIEIVSAAWPIFKIVAPVLNTVAVPALVIISPPVTVRSPPIVPAPEVVTVVNDGVVLVAILIEPVAFVIAMFVPAVKAAAVPTPVVVPIITLPG